MGLAGDVSEISSQKMERKDKKHSVNCSSTDVYTDAENLATGRNTINGGKIAIAWKLIDVEVLIRALQ